MFRKGGGPENLHLGAVRSVRRVERPVRLSLICNRISASPGCLSRPRGAAITTAHWNATLGRTPRASAESVRMFCWGFSYSARSPGGVSGDLSDLGWLQRLVALGRWQGIGKVLPSGLDLHGRRAARSWASLVVGRGPSDSPPGASASRRYFLGQSARKASAWSSEMARDEDGSVASPGNFSSSKSVISTVRNVGYLRRDSHAIGILAKDTARRR